MLHADVSTRVGELRLEVALEVGAGRCLAIAGPSGAGKTSLLRIVAGLLRPERGTIRLAHEVWLDGRRCLPPEWRRCGFVFQDYALFGHMSAVQNVAYGLRGGRRRERAAALLERFGIAGAVAGARPATLSGGERQRVALARALASEPRVLLLDEPLSALDPALRAAAASELRALLRAQPAPALLVTHDFGEAALLGDQVAIVDQGAILQRGSASELAARPASAFVARLAGAVVLHGVAAPGPYGLTAVELDDGGLILSTDAAPRGAVAASVYPWDIGIEPAGSPLESSRQNRIEAEVTVVTEIGNRARVGLRAAQPLAAEVSVASARGLGLAPGVRVAATWKASATRLARSHEP